MVKLEGHQSASGSQKIATQEVTSESSALSVNGLEDHRGDDCLPEAQTLLPDESIHNQRTSIGFVSLNNTESLEAVCLREAEQALVNAGEVHEGSSPLVSAQLHEAGIVSALLRSNDNYCGDIALPGSVAEGQSDQMVQAVADQTLDLNSQCVKTDFDNLEPTSNGHVSSPTLSVPATGSHSEQKALHLPLIVKHKPSSITFLHYTCPSGADAHSFLNESSDDGESSPGEEKEDDDPDYDDDDDDDVFKELPQSRELLVNHRSNDKQKRRRTTRKCDNEAEPGSSSKEVCCYLFNIIHSHSVLSLHCTEHIHQ